MTRSLMIILVMGLLTMVFLAGMGSYFVGKVGGLENVGPLRGEMKRVYGHQMKNRDALKILLVKEEAEEGLAISFEPSAALVRDPGRRDRQLKRMANYVMGQPEWMRLSFVELRLLLSEGVVHESRITRSVEAFRPD
jgi:hypothetical protein